MENPQDPLGVIPSRFEHPNRWGYKAIIAGSRSITDLSVVGEAVESARLVHPILEVVCGGARGVDRLGAQWAVKCRIPVTVFHADWDTYGKRAGFIRNEEMAQYANCLIAIWDGKSKGTAHMIETMEEEGNLVSVYIPGVGSEKHDVAFAMYHHRRPEIYREFERLALEMWNTGRKRYSARAIMHVIRWHTDLHGPGRFKISNTMVRRYAKLLIRNHPEMTGFFEFRGEEEKP